MRSLRSCALYLALTSATEEVLFTIPCERRRQLSQFFEREPMNPLQANYRIKFATLALLTAIAIPCGSAKGAVVLSLTASEATVDQSGGEVIFTGTISGDAGEILKAYDLYLDVSGRELPSADVTIDQQTGIAFGNDFPFGFSVGSNGRDIGFTNGSFTDAGALPMAGGLDLFSFRATFRPGLTVGETISFDYDLSAQGTGIVGPGDSPFNLASIAATGASVTVTAVPEPSAILLSLCSVAGVLVRRRTPVRKE